jgi:hypothetical protein
MGQLRIQQPKSTGHAAMARPPANTPTPNTGVAARQDNESRAREYGSFHDWPNVSIPGGLAAGAAILERHDDPEPSHIVGRWQEFLDRLRLKVPRALCGELLVADPDQPGPTPDSPLCPRCAEKGRTRGQFVDTHQVIAKTR